MSGNSFVQRVCFSLFGMALAIGASAQGFPARQIQILVPFPPGGPTDVLARVLADKMGTSMNTTVVVDNRPGGAAQIAINALKLQPADGHTLLIGDMGALAINQSLYAKLSYDTMKDLQPLALLLSGPMVLTVPAANPAKTVAEFIQFANAKQGGGSYASQGIGTGGHLVGELFRLRTGATLTHVPYKGGAPAGQDLVAGRVDMLFDVPFAFLPNIREGKLRPIGVATTQRAASLPNVATLEEQGYAGITMAAWFGAVTRTGTPPAVVAKLSDELVKATRLPDVNKRFTDMGFDLPGQGAEAFGKHMAAEMQRWGDLIRTSGIKAE